VPDNLRVVVADDSALFRAVLGKVLGEFDGVQVVGQASNGKDAVELVKQLDADVLTLDLNMPVLDGLGALRELKQLRLKCEVIVVSGVSSRDAAVTLEALQLGAVDFIAKPVTSDAAASSAELKAQVKPQLAAIRLRRGARERQSGAGPRSSSSMMMPTPKAVSFSQLRAVQLPEIIAIGASTGGPAALPVLLAALPGTLRVPIVLAQHMPPTFTASLAESLDRKCAVKVVEGRNGQALQPATVYIAPGGQHMKVSRSFDGKARLLLTDDPPEHHCRPAVDYLFRSVAAEFGGRAIAVLLTGMGCDGVAGMRELKGKGAVTIAQDEASCTVYGMPKEAVKAGVVDRVLPLVRIAEGLQALLSSNGT
jgi:two-component system chemotaxis response regulator CheB